MCRDGTFDNASSSRLPRSTPKGEICLFLDHYYVIEHLQAWIVSLYKQSRRDIHHHRRLTVPINRFCLNFCESSASFSTFNYPLHPIIYYDFYYRGLQVRHFYYRGRYGFERYSNRSLSAYLKAGHTVILPDFVCTRLRYLILRLAHENNASFRTVEFLRLDVFGNAFRSTVAVLQNVYLSLLWAFMRS